jgi:hypothetical protein
MAPMISQTRSSTGPIRIFPVKATREQTEMSNPGKSNHPGRSPQMATVLRVSSDAVICTIPYRLTSR